MSLVLASLLAASLVGPVDATMPPDFLQVESKAWSKWLDGKLNISWTGILLKDVLAGEFGAAELAIDDAKLLNTPITFDAAKLTRRAALWQLSQKFGFSVRWAQKDEPRVFLGLSEAEERKRQVGNVMMTVMTPVRRSEYKTYQERKRAGVVTKEEVMGGMVYYAIDENRELHFAEASAWVTEVQRYKAMVPRDAAKD